MRIQVILDSLFSLPGSTRAQEREGGSQRLDYIATGLKLEWLKNTMAASFYEVRL